MIDRPIQIAAINSCIAELQSNPEALGNFVADTLLGKHKNWQLYNQELGRHAEMNYKGRSIPIHTSRPKGAMELAKLIVDDRPSLQTLNLSGLKNTKHRVKAILNSKCDKGIMMDFLTQELRYLKPNGKDFNTVMLAFKEVVKPTDLKEAAQ